jgi:hypothetical protein
MAANHSTVDDWWTVNTIIKITSENKDITPISPRYIISSVKVLIGSAVFLMLGIFLSFIVMKRKQLKLS